VFKLSSTGGSGNTGSWGTQKAKSTPKPAWDGDLGSMDFYKMYSGAGENPEPMSLKISTQQKRAFAIAFDNKIDGYETMSDLYRDALAKGLYMILMHAPNASASTALERYIRSADSEVKVKQIESWKRAVERRRIEVENITTSTDMATWIDDCTQDAALMTGKCQEDMLRLIERHS
jgi:hypothetical protein